MQVPDYLSFLNTENKTSSGSIPVENTLRFLIDSAREVIQLKTEKLYHQLKALDLPNLTAPNLEETYQSILKIKLLLKDIMELQELFLRIEFQQVHGNPTIPSANPSENQPDSQFNREMGN
ncbi:MAG: hypothetical protein K9I34_02240 [Bacteroidales bacterium]|nr:hypothetical protein [Bacteroidales bacterium]